MLKLLAFVLPLGLDSFAVAAALGASQVTTAWQRLRISLVFVIFEGGMPLIDEQPRTGIRSSRVAFLHPRGTGGVLTEIVQPAAVEGH